MERDFGMVFMVHFHLLNVKPGCPVLLQKDLILPSEDASYPLKSGMDFQTSFLGLVLIYANRVWPMLFLWYWN